MVFKRWFLGIVFALLFWPVFGQDSLQYDHRLEVNTLHFDREQLEDYRSNPAFNYTENLDAHDWWEEFVEWLKYLWTSFWSNWLSGVEPGNWLVVALTILKYVFVVGVIVLIIWLFWRLNPGRAFIKPTSPPDVLLSEEAELMQQSDLKALLNSAVEQRDYRLAIRYMYLLILQQLRDEERIIYSPEKTNHDYQIELETTALASDFTRVAELYNVIWYGDFHIDEQQYSRVNRDFKKLESHLKSVTHD